MKNNLISAIAGWKSAALLVLVAMVAAVAFSGVLTTNTAHAANVPLADGESSVKAAPGDTVNIIVSTQGPDFVQVAIDPSSTASGGFGSSGAQSISCADGDPCDTGKTPLSDPPTDIEDSIQVSLKIDEDSPEGHIIVKLSPIGGAADSTKVINVSKAGQPGSISVSAGAKSIAAAPDVDAVAANRMTQLTARLLNAQADPVGLNTTGGATDGVKFDVDGPGTLTCGGNPGGQVCVVPTTNQDPDGAGDAVAADGYAIATITSTGRPGTITVTALYGGLEATTTIVVYGNPTSITAVAQQSSIEIGGATFIVVTATDADGNPVSGKEYGLISPDGNVGPAEKAVQVVVSEATNKEAVPGAVSVAPGSKDLPSCAAHNEIPASDGPLVVVQQDASSGTNAAGKCVIKVSATKGATAAASSTRGTHTITVDGPGAAPSTNVAVEIQVGGAPSEITTDAPARVDALSSTKITVSVVDDEGVPVGAVAASVNQIEGDGVVLGSDAIKTTSDGSVSFTYLAPSRDGTAVFRVTAGSGAGTIAHNVVLDIGAAPEEAPDAPPATWSAPIASGTHNLVWNGDDGADVADGSAEGVTAIWQWNGTGWDGYFPAAADVPGGNTLDELTNGGAYWVIVE